MRRLFFSFVLFLVSIQIMACVPAQQRTNDRQAPRWTVKIKDGANLDYSVSSRNHCFETGDPSRPCPECAFVTDPSTPVFPTVDVAISFTDVDGLQRGFVIIETEAGRETPGAVDIGIVEGSVEFTPPIGVSTRVQTFSNYVRLDFQPIHFSEGGLVASAGGVTFSIQDRFAPSRVISGEIVDRNGQRSIIEPINIVTDLAEAFCGR